MKPFEGQTVVVTGGNKGIGYGLCARVASEGANVVMVATETQVTEAAAKLAADTGAKVEPVVCDVTHIAQVRAVYDRAEVVFGPVDVSIRNAGVITIARIEDMTENEWDFVMDVNTKGVFLCCQEAIRRMRASGKGGRLINAASGQARDGFIYTPHYAASKMGVVGITQSLAKDVALDDIPVNAICSGIIPREICDYTDKVLGEMLGDCAPGAPISSA